MTKIILDELNDDNRDYYFKIALSMYIGEKCKYCKVTFSDLDSLEDAVWAGYHQWGRLAHKSCWDKHNEV